MISAIAIATFLAVPLQDPPAKPAEPVAAASDVAVDDAAVVREQLPSYPLTTCAISGKELGSMGDPIDLVVEGRLVRLCCKGCTKRAEAGIADVGAKIDAAVVKAQAPIYPLEKCVISGEKLDSMGGPVDVVVGTRLIRVCCKSCTKEVRADAKKHLAVVDAALIRALRSTYPLEVCVVSGEKLGSMGEPEDVLYGVRLVRLCCGSCKKPFEKDPQKFLAELDGEKEGEKKAGDAGGGDGGGDGD